MEIRNLLEELVVAVVHEICDDDKAAPPARYCDTPECRTDAICYVLNRTSPRYVSSGRGYAHLMEELQDDQQLQIDMVRLAHEGLKRVSAVSRGYYETSNGEIPAGACYNFSTIKGRVLNGATFSPMSNVTVTLRHQGVVATMFDHRWSNPYQISDVTPGMYNFWPASVPAEREGQEQTFEFELLLECPGFTPMTHHFSLDRVSEHSALRVVSLQRDHRMPDLYLF